MVLTPKYSIDKNLIYSNCSGTTITRKAKT